MIKLQKIARIKRWWKRFSKQISKCSLRLRNPSNYIFFIQSSQSSSYNLPVNTIVFLRIHIIISPTDNVYPQVTPLNSTGMHAN